MRVKLDKLVFPSVDLEFAVAGRLSAATRYEMVDRRFPVNNTSSNEGFKNKNLRFVPHANTYSEHPLHPRGGSVAMETRTWL